MDQLTNTLLTISASVFMKIIGLFSLTGFKVWVMVGS